MSRSVYVPSTAATTVYLADVADEPDDFDAVVEDLRDVIGGQFASFRAVDEWESREGRVILANDHAHVVIAEYCGLVSISLVPREDYNMPELAAGWCSLIEANFCRRLQEAFPVNAVRKLGSMSNGEGVYEPLEA